MRRKIILCCSFFCFIMPGCEDIFLKDLSGEQVVILSPLDNALFESEKILFAWDKMDGADRYRIEVASLSFERGSPLYDTVADTTRIELSLCEGKYQWSIYAYNSGYKTKKTIRSFEIKKDEE